MRHFAVHLCDQDKVIAMRLSIRIGKKKLNAEITFSTIPYIPVAGISSRCKDRKHVLFLETAPL